MAHGVRVAAESSKFHRTAYIELRIGEKKQEAREKHRASFYYVHNLLKTLNLHPVITASDLELISLSHWATLRLPKPKCSFRLPAGGTKSIYIMLRPVDNCYRRSGEESEGEKTIMIYLQQGPRQDRALHKLVGTDYLLFYDDTPSSAYLIRVLVLALNKPHSIKCYIQRACAASDTNTTSYRQLPQQFLQGPLLWCHLNFSAQYATTQLYRPIAGHLGPHYRALL